MEIVNTVHKSNKKICLGSQEVQSVYKCTAILVTRPSMMFEDFNVSYFNMTYNNTKTPIKRIQYLMDKK